VNIDLLMSERQAHVLSHNQGAAPVGCSPSIKVDHDVSLLTSAVHAIHMLRHACGYALANAGHDTRSLQAYLGHRNIQNTTRYTALAPDRFKGFWKD
jgi:site-specific recombinase XerD